MINVIFIATLCGVLVSPSNSCNLGSRAKAAAGKQNLSGVVLQYLVVRHRPLYRGCVHWHCKWDQLVLWPWYQYNSQQHRRKQQWRTNKEGAPHLGCSNPCNALFANVGWCSYHSSNLHSKRFLLKSLHSASLNSSLRAFHSSSHPNVHRLCHQCWCLSHFCTQECWGCGHHSGDAQNCRNIPGECNSNLLELVSSSLVCNFSFLPPRSLHYLCPWNQRRPLDQEGTDWQPYDINILPDQCTMCTLFSIFFRATSSDLYWNLSFGIHWAYICPSLFECAKHFFTFLWFSNSGSVISPKICPCIHPFFPKYAPVSTPSSLRDGVK